MDSLLQAEMARDSAFELLVREGSRKVLSLFWSRGLSHQEAEDLTQETLLRAWRGLGRLEDPGARDPWLLRIAENVYKNHLRRGSAGKRGGRQAVRAANDDDLEFELADPGPNALATALSSERSRELRTAIEALPSAQRRVLLLYLDGESYRDIALLLQVAEETVRSHLYQARRRLRALLAGPGGTP